MKGYLTALIACVICLSCTKEAPYDFVFNKDKATSGRIVIAPMIDQTSHGLPWNVSREITSEVRDNLMREGNPYMVSEQKSIEMLRSIPQSSFFSKDLGPLNNVEGADYIVFSELVEHEVMNKANRKTKKDTDDQVLLMKVRVRVVDLTGSYPIVAYDETLRSNHEISASSTPTNYRAVSWKTSQYPQSPMGKAHGKLITTITSKVEKHTS